MYLIERRSALKHTYIHAQRLRQRFDAHLEHEYQASLSYDITADGQGPDAFEGKWYVGVVQCSLGDAVVHWLMALAGLRAMCVSAQHPPLRLLAIEQNNTRDPVYNRKRMRHPKGEELHAPVATGVPLDVRIRIRALSLPLILLHTCAHCMSTHVSLDHTQAHTHHHDPADQPNHTCIHKNTGAPPHRQQLRRPPPPHRQALCVAFPPGQILRCFAPGGPGEGRGGLGDGGGCVYLNTQSSSFETGACSRLLHAHKREHTHTHSTLPQTHTHALKQPSPSAPSSRKGSTCGFAGKTRGGAPSRSATSC